MNDQMLAAIKFAVRTALKEVGKDRLSTEEFFGTNQRFKEQVKLAA
tara:strand:- start:19210 stop:19347 length:138 start_codon:yes stop_codon:yes gene_type:complete